jgi:hypothetical protein
MMGSISRAATGHAIQLVNRCEPIGSWLLKDSVAFDEDAIVAAAQLRAGLTDFGDVSFRDGLRELLRSYETEAQLSLIGRLSAREYLVSLLTNLLYMERDRQLDPGIDNEKIPAPIFMLGLPRTGSTMLHALLAQDSGYRVPLTWEVMFPSAGRSGHETDPAQVRRCARNLRWFHRMSPKFKPIHAVGADLPQECIAITPHVMQSILFHTMHNVPSYQDWLDRNGYREAYRFHRKFLMHLQHARGSGRWLLKAPGHLFSLADLIAEYPDAVFIQTHRAPAKVIGSISSHAIVLRNTFSEVVDERATAEDWVRRWDGALANALEVRAQAQNKFVDVMYQDLEANPMQVVREIYTAIGAELTSETEARMERHLSRNPKGSHGVHRYAVSEIGQESRNGSGNFGIYQQKFNIPEESTTD